jgi:small subunit ribosomal protein S11
VTQSLFGDLSEDSKKLSEKTRIAIEKDIKDNAICWGIAEISPEDIDKKGLTWANEMVMYTAAKNAATKALELGMEKVEIIIKGRGNGRESSIRALKLAGLSIVSIEDKTGVAHNGCRPPKKRRL